MKKLVVISLLPLLTISCWWHPSSKALFGQGNSRSLPAQDQQWEKFIGLVDKDDDEAINVFLDNHEGFVNSTHDWLENKDYTPLHYAAEEGVLVVVEALITRGAHINAQTAGGGTPLHYAAAHDHLEIVEYLFQALEEQNRGEVEMEQDQEGMYPLHVAVIEENVRLTEYIISKTPQTIMQSDRLGSNLLHLAATLENREIIETLHTHIPAVSWQSMVQQKNQDNHTPSQLAKKPEIRQMLKPKPTLQKKNKPQVRTVTGMVKPRLY